jgi:4-amino-4-deoxy-L-arabinose transferase-like glycosyltransferase
MLAALAVAAFAALLGRRDLASHEARVFEPARLMALSGWPWDARPVVTARRVVSDEHPTPAPDELDAAPHVAVNPWLIPIFDGLIRLQKPPLAAWSAAVSFRALGVSEGAARLPVAMLALLGTALVWDLARQLAGRRVAWLTALAWVSTHFVLVEYRKATPDPFLAFAVLGCAWAWIRGSSSSSSSSASSSANVSSRTRGSGWMLLFYVALGLGALAKGPVVLVHAGVLVAAHLACYRRPVPGRGWAHAAGAAVFLVISLPWPAYVLSRLPEAAELWRYETGGIGGIKTRHAAPALYYVPRLLEMSLPWTPVWILGVAVTLLRWRRRGGGRGGGSASVAVVLRPRDRRGLFPLIWCATVIVFFSFVRQKKLAYLLPVMPAVCVTVAVGLRALLAAIRRRAGRRHPWADWLRAAQAVLGVGGAAVVLVVLVRLGRIRHTGHVVNGGIVAAMVAVTLAAAALGAARWRPRAWVTTQAAAYVAALLVMLAFYDPRHHARSTHPPSAGAAEPSRGAVTIPTGRHADPATQAARATTMLSS